MLHDIEAGTTRGRRRYDRSSGSWYVVEFARPELGILQESGLQAPKFRCQRTAKSPTSRLTGRQEDADLVVAEPVRVIFGDVVRRVVLEKATDILVPERESEAAGAAILVREVQAVVVVADVLGAIKIVDAVVVELAGDREATCMVIDDVECHRDIMDVAEINQCLELARARSDIGERQRRQSLASEDAVDHRQIGWKIGRSRDVRKVRREQVGAPVSHAWVGLLLVDRQRLQHVYA